MNFDIRDIQKEDIDLLAIIFADAYRPDKTGEHWTVETARDVVEYWYNRSPADMKILAQTHDNKILGAFMADVKPWWDGSRMIDGEFFVSTNAQGHGIGRSLLIELSKRAVKNHGAKCFETITFEPDTEHPLRWYLSLGFEKVENLVVINGDLEELVKAEK